MKPNPLTPFLESQGFVILDGGLSTELETLGYDLNHPLWTARLLDEEPDAIRSAHLAYLKAGADCIISSSYQASLPGLMKAGYSITQAVNLIKASYRQAVECCDDFYESFPDKQNRSKPIVAASIGPYGAYLADGSEYRGNYGLSIAGLIEFHRVRFEVLSHISDLLAIETIPSLTEAKALAKLLSQSNTRAWVSFSCKDGNQINDGHSIVEAASLFADLPNVVAVGVNCTHPMYVSELISRLNLCCAEKEIVVYPNSGATFCSKDKSWIRENTCKAIDDYLPEWYQQGARLIGGCCRISAEDIARLKQKSLPVAKRIRPR